MTHSSPTHQMFALRFPLPSPYVAAAIANYIRPLQCYLKLFEGIQNLGSLRKIIYTNLPQW